MSDKRHTHEDDPDSIWEARGNVNAMETSIGEFPPFELPGADGVRTQLSQWQKRAFPMGLFRIHQNFMAFDRPGVHTKIPSR